MKLKLLMVAVILACFSFTTVNAQNNNIKFENIVNEQFGTLLESLLTDGKIDEANAKTYLETVFGNDEAVSKYLNTVDIGQQLKGINQGKMTFDNYLNTLNSNLISFIPAEKQQAYLSYMETHNLINGSMAEIASGKIGENTVNLAVELVLSIKENKELKAKNDAIAKKLEKITPTLGKLNIANNSFKKLKIADEVDSEKSWVENKYPGVRETDASKFTSNYSILENGHLLLTTQNYVQAIFNWDKFMFFDPIRFYKNPEKFDFSKDFSMNLYFKINKKADVVRIEIGKGYTITIDASSPDFFTLTTPDSYEVSEVYGKLTANNKGIQKSKPKAVDEDKIIYAQSNKQWGHVLSIRRRKNPIVNFEGVLKLSVIKNGDLFVLKFNDLPGEITTKVNYFPDKYYLGFELSSMNKKANMEIHKLELEHL